MSQAVVSAPLCPLRGRPCRRGEQTDEALYGMVLEVLETQGAWRRVRTPYRYEGWAPARCLRFGEGSVQAWRTLPKQVVLSPACDVLQEPRVRTPALLTLPLGAAVAPAGEVLDGWQRVALAGGGEGYVRAHWLGPYFPAPPAVPEGELRRRLVDAARRYLGAQYRWGGKTPWGIDCSGLASMAYLLNGIVIWRDAALREDFPIRPIPREAMGPGDLLYFPGHVALYLGEGRYIHATARAGCDGVCINSLEPAHDDYRPDLAERLTAVGSYF